MDVFYFLFIVLFFSSLLFNRSKVWGIFLIFLMAFICAFRGINVGSDTINYYQNNFSGEASFEKISSSSLVDLEFGFQLISGFIDKLELNPRWCVFSLAIITYVFLSMAALRFNRIFETNVVIVALLYFIMGYYALTFNISRQMAATSILLYGYSFLFQDKRKIMYFFVYVLLAASFHISSFMYLLFFLIRYVNFSKINPKQIIVSSVGLLLFIQLFKEFILNFIMDKSEAFSLYTKYMQQTEESTISVAGFVFEVLKLSLSLYVYYRLKNFANSRLINMYLASIFIDLLFSAFYGNIYRMNIGFSIIQIIAYAVYLSKFVYVCSLSPKLKFRITDETAFFILMIVVYGYDTLSGLSRGAYDIVPYYIEF